MISYPALINLYNTSIHIGVIVRTKSCSKYFMILASTLKPINFQHSKGFPHDKFLFCMLWSPFLFFFFFASVFFHCPVLN